MTDKTNDKQKHESKLIERQKEASLVRKIVLICFFVILLTIAGATYATYQYVVNAIGPVDESDEEMIEVEIPIGSTSTRIGSILEEHDLVSSGSMFRYYVRYKNEDGFQAGDYELSRSMSMDEIIDELKEGTIYEEYQLTFTIPEGRWLEEVTERIANETNLEKEELVELVHDEEYLESLIERYTMLSETILDENIRWPLEGYIFPARYDFVEEEVTAEQVIQAMLDRTAATLEEYNAGGSDMSYHEILTIASIIEGEARNDEEREIISGVIHNRLNIGMALQMDPTVAYAHGEHISRTLYEDLEIDSPYNTYQISGLPIGPINNPGAASIRTALQPVEHSYLYFYHAADGEVYFSETYSEHQQVLEQHRD
ncbi:endolytic transglycosylase MltG [Bacillus shivajii]|uniref:endolytic transglycosylase MltG n=1 Tax=Bacillus shivajii TaxID=1983719 RepID=UPI001CFB597C|nr:endolytic transglycosylase MltG [Bacillus shivajii]UCZ54389.1 endolytic transglycosylase MltG [Bacillus shivajii]